MIIFQRSLRPWKSRSLPAAYGPRDFLLRWVGHFALSPSYPFLLFAFSFPRSPLGTRGGALVSVGRIRPSPFWQSVRMVAMPMDTPGLHRETSAWDDITYVMTAPFCMEHHGLDTPSDIPNGRRSLFHAGWRVQGMTPHAAALRGHLPNPCMFLPAPPT